MITADDLVRREVHLCVSSLVHTLAQGYGNVDERPGSGADLRNLTEQAFELAAPIDDYESAAYEAGWTLKAFGKARKWVNPANDDGSAYLPTESGVRHLCEDHDIEPHQREVYEHWAVSDWLADKLEAHGEKIDRAFANLTVWARTTTGQAISIDAVIKRIHAELTAPKAAQ